MLLEVKLPHSGSSCLLPPRWHDGQGLGWAEKRKVTTPALLLTPLFELPRASPMVACWPVGECVYM